MWPNPQFPAYVVTFTDEILNRKLHFLCSESYDSTIRSFTFLFLLTTDILNAAHKQISGRFDLWNFLYLQMVEKNTTLQFFE